MLIKIINNYPNKKEIQNAFMDICENPTLEEFTIFYNKIKDKHINMSAIIDYLFRNSNNYLDTIDELLDQIKLYNEIIDDKTDKLYS